MGQLDPDENRGGVRAAEAEELREIRRRVAHPLVMSVCAIYAEGAPSLRFLQGRVTMLPTQLLWLCATRSRMRSRFPPFAKCAKDGAPTMFLAPARSKAWATRLWPLYTVARCSLTHSSPLRFESPLSQVQGDLRLLLTFTYHGCPHVSRPKFKYSASAVFANAGEVLLDVIASGQAGAVFSVCPVPHPRAHHLKWSPVGVPLPGHRLSATLFSPPKRKSRVHRKALRPFLLAAQLAAIFALPVKAPFGEVHA